MTHEVNDYYVSNVSDNGGRWVHEEYLLLDGFLEGGVDEAMAWLVGGDGNLLITITSSGDKHQIALANFSVIFRPNVVAIQAEMADTLHDNSERLVQFAEFESEVSGRVDLIEMAGVAGNYHFASSVDDHLLIAAGGSFQEVCNTFIEYDGTRTLDVANDYFYPCLVRAFCSEEGIMVVKSIVVDTDDADNYGYSTEDIYNFAGRWEVDATTGLGSFFRDMQFLVPLP